VITSFQDRAPVKELCLWAGLPRSSFYYKPSDGQRGFKPSTTTFKTDGSQVDNEQVIEQIKIILSGEFVCYGYQKTAVTLKEMGYVINHKKVYRLMDEKNLLLGKVIKTSGLRKWVSHRKINAAKPMEYLCLDIKYLWVEGERRHYYLLTILDVYSRKVMAWILQKSIKKIDVINLFRTLNSRHSIKGVNIRNDNGSQFIANDVKAFLRAAEANQEFTHIATPEENSYIEAYHSILDTEVVRRFEFAGYYDAKCTIMAYVDFYNNRRIHGGIGYRTPQRMWDEYQNSNLAQSGEAETGSAEEQPARNSPASEERSEGVRSMTPSTPSLSLLNHALENLPNTPQLF
jgi:transposase InsO family protein